MSETLPAAPETDPSTLPGLSERRVRLAEKMVYEGQTYSEAAVSAGLGLRAAQYAVRDPRWIGFYRQLCHGLRESLRAKAIHRLDELMGQDDNRMAAIRAAQHFDEPQRAGNVFSLNVGVNVATPGYTVMPAERRAELMAILKAGGSTKNVLDLDLQPEPDEPGEAA